MAQFDNRIFKLVFTYGKTTLELDGGLDIKASGVQYFNEIQDECSIVISNLKRETRDNLATQLMPMFNGGQERKGVEVWAGRVSTGLFLLYRGDITYCMASQPPNIALHIKSKTAQWWKYDLLKQAHALNTPRSSIVAAAASSMGLNVQYEATDQIISSYSYTGAAIKQIDKINSLGGVDTFIDGDTLVCKDKGVPRKNSSADMSAQTGMIGIPELTEVGIRVRALLSNTCKIGGQIKLDCKSNPFLNDTYLIYQMGFEIASRDTPFYTIIEAERAQYQYIPGATALNLPAP